MEDTIGEKERGETKIECWNGGGIAAAGAAPSAAAAGTCCCYGQ